MKWYMVLLISMLCSCSISTNTEVTSAFSAVLNWCKTVLISNQPDHILPTLSRSLYSTKDDLIHAVLKEDLQETLKKIQSNFLVALRILKFSLDLVQEFGNSQNLTITWTQEATKQFSKIQLMLTKAYMINLMKLIETQSIYNMPTIGMISGRFQDANFRSVLTPGVMADVARRALKSTQNGDAQKITPTFLVKQTNAHFSASVDWAFQAFKHSKLAEAKKHWSLLLKTVKQHDEHWRKFADERQRHEAIKETQFFFNTTISELTMNELGSFSETHTLDENQNRDFQGEHFAKVCRQSLKKDFSMREDALHDPDLLCWLDDKGSTFGRLMEPIRVEKMHSNPDLIIFHNAFSSKQCDLIIDELEKMEQVQFYESGEFYGHHRDAFSDLNASIPTLNDVELGGATAYPEIGTFIKPVKGTATLMVNHNPDGTIAQSMTHGGCPVVSGVKWVGVKWLHGPSKDGGGNRINEPSQ
ncbi:unnamed protein product [Notodromas monacha]|uniref:Fe2OG dioxygenase domain-containing protein n=1 Tax=Notodromas monacha TaxID=399045 RepID=A0A7R9BCK4_9CRUS|nr:unnamed protein product [Notodromas monacha]CAG0912812.1 unnamed protein product [Notodromas monacha]